VKEALPASLAAFQNKVYIPQKLRYPNSMGAEQASSGRTFLEELSDELGAFSATLTRYAADERQRREAAARERITAAQLRAVLAARYARSERLGMDLASPGWSLLLELFVASLETRTVRLPGLAGDARVPSTTALRWIEAFVAAGLVAREADARRDGVSNLALTDAGKEAMEDYFVTLQLGCADADTPLWTS
jgi:DNA-binding MarR family transcriptional regulator